MGISDWSSDVCSSDLHVLFGLDAGFIALLADPEFLRAPIDVLFRLEHVGAAAAEAKDRAAHRLDGDIARQDHQVRPAQLLAIFLLDRPEQAARLVEIGIVRPAVERRETLRSGGSAAAPVAGDRKSTRLNSSH